MGSRDAAYPEQFIHHGGPRVLAKHESGSCFGECFYANRWLVGGLRRGVTARLPRSAAAQWTGSGVWN